jgi:hypothetical protein
VDVEGDLLGVRCPAFIAEAVVVFSIGQRGERVVIGGDGLLEVLAVSQGIFDLDAWRPTVSIFVPKQSQLSLCMQLRAIHCLYECNTTSQHFMQRGHVRGTSDTGNQKARDSYPEIHLKIPTPSKLPISNLESDGHDIVAVQGLVEAFS